MTMLRFDPLRGFEKVQRKMSDLMEDLNKGFSVETGGFNPRVDIIDDEKNVFVHAELPGLNKDDIKISINDENIMTIKGEKKPGTGNVTYLRAERYFGNFCRSFYLPDNLNRDAVSAKFEDGVLMLTVPKIEPQQPKEVEINIA